MPVSRRRFCTYFPISLAGLAMGGTSPVLALSRASALPSAGIPKLLFGAGPEADGALVSSFVSHVPVRMLTNWYNGPDDLSWITGWKADLVPGAYAQAYALHLIVFCGDPEVPVDTPYGPACGRAYPLSARFVSDMAILAQTFAGDGPLYVTLFTEFQTYPCQDNQWGGGETYYRALKDQYRAALAAFHQNAPNAKVSLGWGGWQTRWDDPTNGGGLSLFPYFVDVMNASDFQSFQAMQSDSNVSDVQSMTRVLGQYGPVMLAHYRPDNGSSAVATADLETMLTDTYLTGVTANGLFAWSFMDTRIVSAPESLYQFVKRAVTRYER